METPKPNSLEKQMGHKPPQIKCLYHQKKVVIEPDALLRGLE